MRISRAVALLIAVGAVGIATALAVVMVGGAGSPTAAPKPNATGNLSAGGLTAADADFVAAMVAQHEQTAAILRRTDTRITDGELATMVAAIDATQADELTVMRAWLAGGAGSASAGSSPGHSHPPAAPDARDLAALDAVPAGEFDAAFANLLIARQQTAGELARTELDSGADPTVLSLARRIADSRAAQVSQLLRMVARLRT